MSACEQGRIEWIIHWYHGMLCIYLKDGLNIYSYGKIFIREESFIISLFYKNINMDGKLSRCGYIYVLGLHTRCWMDAHPTFNIGHLT